MYELKLVVVIISERSSIEYQFKKGWSMLNNKLINMWKITKYNSKNLIIKHKLNKQPWKCRIRRFINQYGGR